MEEKLAKKGKKLYQKFCRQYPDIEVATPRTQTLALFGALKGLRKEELLLRALMEEFLTNIDDKGLVFFDGLVHERVVLYESFLS